MANKRSSDFIDLTQSSDAENNPPPSKKQARTVNQFSHTTSHAPQRYGSQSHNHSLIHSQVRGSQPRSSQSLGPRDAWSNTQATQQDDENEIIDLSQDVDDYGWVCLGAIDGKIVGVRYVISQFYCFIIACVSNYFTGALKGKRWSERIG